MAAGRRAYCKDTIRIDVVKLCMGPHMHDCQSQIHLGQRITVGAQTVMKYKSFIPSVPFHPLSQLNPLPVGGMCLVPSAGTDYDSRPAALSVGV